MEILRDIMGANLPETPLIQQEDRSFNTRRSDDLETDLIFTMGPRHDPAHAIIVEVQQDKSKNPRQLARYAAAAWLMLDCDVTVLVICPNRATADHYSQPIASGLTGYRLRAWVIGPDEIPAIIDPDEAAAQVTHSILSVMMHGRDRKVLLAFFSALNKAPRDHAPQYYEYAYSMAPPDIRRLLEELVNSTDWLVSSPFAREHFGCGLEEGKAEGRAEGKVEGKAEEAAKMVLLVLSARGLDVPDDTRARITACTDLPQLETWATRAVTVQTVHELFGESV